LLKLQNSNDNIHSQISDTGTSSEKDNGGWDTYMDYEANPFITTPAGELVNSKTAKKINESVEF
jgi:hypothetical protein